MKRTLLLFVILGSALLSLGQQLTYEYSYDNAGNRTRRAVVRLDSQDRGNTALGPLVDKGSDGATLTLFPNPTKGTVRLETSGASPLDSYTLSDANGRVVAGGACGGRSLSIDLSDKPDGVYLLQVSVEGVPHVYKIIKQ